VVVKGTPFGRYELIELLGRGGMGEVWKAFDTATQRVVAVKVLPAQLAADPMFEQRFRREAFTAAGLNNPHVVPIHNFGEIDGRLYVDMRLIEGEDLEHTLAHGALEPERAVKIVEQISSALNAAHRVGLVHRDVKPSNILIAEDDFAYLIDFGIARAASETKLTATGNVVGTWAYMAPERFSTGVSDARSDIYALACVLYECLTSNRPFPGDSVEQQIAGHLTTPPPRPSISRPEVSQALDAVVTTGMAKDPEDRYSTTTEMARAARKALTAVTPTTAADPEHTAIGVAPGSPTEVLSAQPAEAWAPTQARPAEAADEAWAPTQAGPPEHVQQAWAATQSGTPEHVDKAWASTQLGAAEPTDVRPVESDQPLPWWQRMTVVIPIAAVLMIAAVVTIFSVIGGGGTKPPQAAPLNGTYTVEFGADERPNGQSDGNPSGGSETWVITSACQTEGCVATATKVNGSQSAASTMVLDQVGGRWVAVSAAHGTCVNSQVESWEAMSLQLRPDGTLDGRFVVRTTASCATDQQVKFTRVSDVKPEVSVADPKAQPPRVPSPAQGLHGKYQETDTYADGGRNAEANFDIATYCLRTGDRCLSYWQSPSDTKVLVFAQNQWTLANTSQNAKCTNGSPASGQVTLQYPLPQPAQDPIPLLTGRGHYTVSGQCPFNSDFDSRVQRTGD
jgi:serine/threonine-protein kinase